MQQQRKMSSAGSPVFRSLTWLSHGVYLSHQQQVALRTDACRQKRVVRMSQIMTITTKQVAFRFQHGFGGGGGRVKTNKPPEASAESAADNPPLRSTCRLLYYDVRSCLCAVTCLECAAHIVWSKRPYVSRAWGPDHGRQKLPGNFLISWPNNTR